MADDKLPELALPGDEAVKLNKDYIVVSLEKFTSEVQGFMGWRVTLDGGSDDILTLPLWTGDIVSRNSKLGSFIVALGNSPEEWTGHVIQFIFWQPGSRDIKLVK